MPSLELPVKSGMEYTNSRYWRESVGRREPSYTVGNVNWYSYYGKQYRVPLKKKKLSYHMTLQSHSWGYIQRKNMIWKDACTPIFIAALFTIARTWKQPKCPPTEEWVEKMGYIYTMGYYPAIKRNETMPFAVTRMGLESVILSEISHTEKEKYRMMSLICGI